METNDSQNTEEANQENPRPKRASLYFDEDEDYNIQDSENPMFNECPSINLENDKANDKINDKTNSYKSLMKNSGFFGVLNIMASAIGGGSFSFPKIIDNIGPIYSLIIFLLVSFSIYYSLEILRSFIIKTNLFSYAEITNKAIGKKVHRMYCVFSIILFLSIIINYNSLIYSYFDDILELNKSKYGKMIFFSSSSVIEIILCIFTSQLSKVHILSAISIISFVVILFIEIYLSVQNIIVNGFERKFSNVFLPYSNFYISDLFKILSIFTEYIYAYTYHCSFPTLIGNLLVKNENETKKINKISFICIFASYILISIFGYISTLDVSDILFQNYYSSNYSFFVVAFKIILCIFLLSLIPIRYIVIRDSYTSLIFINIPNYAEKIITIINLVIANVIGYFISGKDEENDTHLAHIKTLVELFGGIFGVYICFILPVITYMYLNEDKCSLKSVIGYIIAIAFTIIGLSSAGFSIYQEIKRR